MDRNVIKKYCQILDLAAADPEYIALCHHYRTLDAKIVEWISGLPRPEADLLLDYVGALVDLEYRLLETTCKHMDFTTE